MADQHHTRSSLAKRASVCRQQLRFSLSVTCATSLSVTGRHSGDLLRWSKGSAGVPAQDLPSSLLAPLMRLQKSFVLSDPRLPDCPIVHASTAFLLMTGYPRSGSCFSPQSASLALHNTKCSQACSPASVIFKHAHPAGTMHLSL